MRLLRPSAMPTRSSLITAVQPRSCNNHCRVRRDLNECLTVDLQKDSANESVL